MIRKRLIIIAAIFLLSLTFCKKEVKTIPDHLRKGTPEYQANMGYKYLNLGSLNIAEEQFQRAIKKRPGYASAIHGLGIVYLKQMKFKKSLLEFKKMVRLDPDNSDAYNFMGIIYSETGDYDLAKENFLIAANSEKYNTPENAFLNLALIEMKQKKMNSALRYIEQGLTKNPEFVQLHNLRGRIYEQKGFYKKAVYSYERALSLSRNKDISIKINIARGYIKMRQSAKALNLLEKMLGEAPSPETRKLIIKMMKQVEKK